MSNFFKYIVACFQEVIFQVSWPTYEELQKLSFFFFTGLLICTLLVGGLDIVLQKGISYLYAFFIS